MKELTRYSMAPPNKGDFAFIAPANKSAAILYSWTLYIIFQTIIMIMTSKIMRPITMYTAFTGSAIKSLPYGPKTL